MCMILIIEISVEGVAFETEPKHLRQLKNIFLRQLSTELDIGVSILSEYENGVYAVTYRIVRQAISDYYGIDSKMVFDEEGYGQGKQ